MEPIWAPNVIQNVKESELDMYICFSSTACIWGGGCSVDDALNVLYQSKGDIKLATKKLLATQTNSTWTENEVISFERLICRHGKNFYKISQDLKSKSIKECVQFYYRWKKSARFHNNPNNNNNNIYTHNYNHSTSSNSNSSTSNIPQSSSSCSSLSLESSENRDSSRPSQQSLAQQQLTGDTKLPPAGEGEQFPCKVCGRIFLKIKSRSAHMKRHKNER